MNIVDVKVMEYAGWHKGMHPERQVAGKEDMSVMLFLFLFNSDVIS